MMMNLMQFSVNFAHFKNNLLMLSLFVQANNHERSSSWTHMQEITFQRKVERKMLSRNISCMAAAKWKSQEVPFCSQKLFESVKSFNGRSSSKTQVPKLLFLLPRKRYYLFRSSLIV